MASRAAVKVDMSGKVCMVTGANTGIGKVTALELARAGAHVVLACRSKDKASAAMAEIEAQVEGAQLTFLALDLGSLSSVRAAVARFEALDLPLHVLVNNAGLAGQTGETEDGFELAFGVNHLGHFLWTELLVPKLEASAPSRVVIVASKAHYGAEAIDWDALRRPTATTTGFPEYQVSKLCNVLHGRALARRFADKGSDVWVCSLHPGVVASDIWRGVPWPFRGVMKLFMVSNEEGAMTSLHCATTGLLADSGSYYDSSKPRRPSKLAQDDALGEQLWQRSAAWAGLESS